MACVPCGVLVLCFDLNDLTSSPIAMSAVRRNPNRAASRSASSLPYARPLAKKSVRCFVQRFSRDFFIQNRSQAWSFATGLFSYLNPMRSRSYEEPESPMKVDGEIDESDSDRDGAAGKGAAESLSSRGHKVCSVPLKCISMAHVRARWPTISLLRVDQIHRPRHFRNYPPPLQRQSAPSSMLTFYPTLHHLQRTSKQSQPLSRSDAAK